MAQPLRFRRSDERWTAGRVRSDLLGPLRSNLGATASSPWFRQPDGYDARRFEMDDGSLALFAWTTDDGSTAHGTDDGRSTDGGSAADRPDRGYWMGNTETPRALWDTTKYAFAEVPPEIADWATRELLAGLLEDEPWLDDYPTLARFFLPVLCSKDGAETARTFFRDHAAGFPDAHRDAALGYYESFLESGALDQHRHTMAAKLGTSESIDPVRMRATMSEFTVAKLLHETGYDLEPEADVTTGHAIDYRVERDGEEPSLVEVTRPSPPRDRSANSPVRALRETAKTKTGGQLQRHGGGVTLFVDCSSFTDADWTQVLDERPDVGHRPAVVFRARPDGGVEGYTHGSPPIELPDGIDG